MNFKTSLFLLLILSMINSEGKIRLMTFHYNRPDFLEYQCKCLNKFLKEKNDYELIVFNDAVDPELRDQIIATCKTYGVQCVIYPQELHNTGRLIEKIKRWGYDAKSGSVRHCQLVQYALDNYGFNHDDIVGIFEGDVFLTRELSLREILKVNTIAGAVQTDRDGMGIEYMWIGLCFIDTKKLINKETFSFDLHFHNDRIFLDSGGSSYYYLKNNPEVPVKKYYRTPINKLPRSNKVQLESMGFSSKEICFLQNMADYVAESTVTSLEFHMDFHFIHFSFSRYNGSTDTKSILFKKYLADILE